MRDSLVRSITDLAEQDDRVLIVTGDLGFGVLAEFADRFPDQFINAGVAEQNMTAVAVGLALEGFKVYTYSIANFSTLRCLEQIRNDVCYHNADVTVVAIGAGFSYGQLGMSHFATEDLAIMRALPNMKVIAPSDPWEAYALAQQLYRIPGPAYIRIDKSSAGLPAAESELRLGQTRVVRRGTDATLISVGGILKEVMAAAEMLEEQFNLSARVLAVHSVKPLDGGPIVEAIDDTDTIVTIEEHSVIGGLGSALLEACAELGRFPRRFRMLGVPDEQPSIVGDQQFLRAHYGLDAASIATVTASMIGESEVVVGRGARRIRG